MKKPLVRPLLAAILVGVMAGTPVAPILAQEPSSPAQGHAAAQGGVPISLGVSKFDFSKRAELVSKHRQSLPDAVCRSGRANELAAFGPVDS